MGRSLFYSIVNIESENYKNFNAAQFIWITQRKNSMAWHKMEMKIECLLNGNFWHQFTKKRKKEKWIYHEIWWYTFRWFYQFTKMNVTEKKRTKEMNAMWFMCGIRNMNFVYHILRVAGIVSFRFVRSSAYALSLALLKCDGNDSKSCNQYKPHGFYTIFFLFAYYKCGMSLFLFAWCWYHQK